MILVTSAAGQDRGSGNHEEAIADGLPGRQAGNAQNCIKLRILSLLHVSNPGQLKMGTETLLLKPIFTNSRFLLKKKNTHTIYPAVLGKVKWSCSVISDSLQPHGLQPPRLLCPWDSPGNSPGVDCHFLLQGIFPTQGLNPGLPHCRQTLYCLSHQRSPLCLVGLTQSSEGWIWYVKWVLCPGIRGLEWDPLSHLQRTFA